EMLNQMRSNVDRAHAAGVRVVGESMRFWNNQLLLIDHPEWQELTAPDAKPHTLDTKKLTDFPPVTGCWNSPFGDKFIEAMVKLAQRLDWDGYNLDGWGCWTTCYCRFCREAYKQETG